MKIYAFGFGTSNILTINSKTFSVLKANSSVKKSIFSINGDQNGGAESKSVLKKCTLDILSSVFHIPDMIQTKLWKNLEIVTYLNINHSQKLVKNSLFSVFSREILFGLGVHILVNWINVAEVFEKLLVIEGLLHRVDLWV